MYLLFRKSVVWLVPLLVAAAAADASAVISATIG
jgi:hypothetical protein